MKDMGEATYILGVKILRDCSKKLWYLSPELYINKILKWLQMQHGKPINTFIAKEKGFSRRMCFKTPQEKSIWGEFPIQLWLEV